jgi:hypothetical protein
MNITWPSTRFPHTNCAPKVARVIKTLGDQSNVSLGRTYNFSTYFELNIKLREFYMGAHGDGQEDIDIYTGEESYIGVRYIGVSLYVKYVKIKHSFHVEM